MDWFPLINSIRIALISTAIVFFLGIFAAYYLRKLPSGIKGFIDCVLTLPLVLPPTVVGFFILRLLSPKSPLGSFVMENTGLKLVMVWPAAIIAVSVVTFPLMYRTARGAFEAFDYRLFHAGQTLGMSNTRIFWTVMMPNCRKGIVAGCVLAFARGLGEYGATNMVCGYTPGRTATISTTVYQLWREGNDVLAYKWVAINLVISFIVLLALNYLERNDYELKRAVK